MTWWKVFCHGSSATTDFYSFQINIRRSSNLDYNFQITELKTKMKNSYYISENENDLSFLIAGTYLVLVGVSLPIFRVVITDIFKG